MNFSDKEAVNVFSSSFQTVSFYGVAFMCLFLGVFPTDGRIKERNKTDKKDEALRRDVFTFFVKVSGRVRICVSSVKSVGGVFGGINGKVSTNVQGRGTLKGSSNG